VASLRLKETAEHLAATLRRQGFRASSTPYGHSRAGWWHAVRIGPFPTRVDAEARRLMLGPTERSTAVVMPRARGKIHLQIASVKSMDQAKTLLDRLRRRGYAARITTVGKVGDDRWHCVRIGPLDTREEADDFRRLLAAREGLDSQVIPFLQTTPPAEERGEPEPLAAVDD
jgi:cell division septation protein DedD